MLSLTCQGRIAEGHKRTADVDGKLRRLYDAIENGVADLSAPIVNDRIVDLKAIRDQARVDAERAQDAIVRPAGRMRMRTENGGYRRDHLRAPARRVEGDTKDVRIMGSKSVLPRSTTPACRVKTSRYPGAGFAAPGPAEPPRAH